MKPISDYLQQLINEANESLATSKEKILYVYNQAIAEEYTPKEARHLVEEKIVNVSSRYLREVLPEEAKQLEFAHKKPISYEEQVPPIQQSTPKIVDIELEQPEEEEQPPLAPYTTTDDIIKVQQELELTQQLLREERAKTAELTERLELERNEHEAAIAQLQDRCLELDRLTDKLTDQLQEKSRQLTTLTMQQDNEIAEPTPEQNYSVEADIPFNGKKLPIVVRCYISGKKIGWIDRGAYKARYGMEPQEE